MDPISIFQAWRERARIDRSAIAKLLGVSTSEVARIESIGRLALTSDSASNIEQLFFADYPALFLTLPFHGSAKLLDELDSAFRDSSRAIVQRAARAC